MSFTAQTTQVPDTHYPSTLRRALARNPVLTFFVLAYAGAWLAFLPLLLARNGLGILPVRLPLVPFLALATLTGPAFSALFLCWLTGGRRALQQLLSRYTLWRFNLVWYLVVLFLPPAGFLLCSSLSLGITPSQTLIQNVVPFISTYPLLIIVGLVTGPLGEELGWRGFALPRLQERMGPLWASLTLGLLWAAWHLPLFLLPEWAGTVNPAMVGLAFFSWVIPFS
ncbi:MAG TPA: type II CAAX endopeptidase family protein, partial [Chloroflexia bacterium]|nr:type II CAAX endopeptidase family protein [Chloroflexia bacterium]